MKEDNLKSLDAAVEACPVVSRIAKPLFDSTPIKNVIYAEYHLSGDVYYFNQNQKLIEEDNNDGELDSIISKIPSFICHDGFMITDYHPYLDLLNAQLKNCFDKNTNHMLGHECEYVCRDVNRGKLSVCYFYTALENDSANSFYLNNTNILKYFIRYFQKELQPVLEKNPPFTNLIENSNQIKSLIENLSSVEIPIPDFLLSYSAKKKITKRQLEIIRWYLKGKTMEETARILEISPRTVEMHINRMKVKLDCRSKTQILLELLKDGLCLDDLCDPYKRPYEE